MEKLGKYRCNNCGLGHKLYFFDEHGEEKIYENFRNEFLGTEKIEKCPKCGSKNVQRPRKKSQHPEYVRICDEEDKNFGKIVRIVGESLRNEYVPKSGGAYIPMWKASPVKKPKVGDMYFFIGQNGLVYQEIWNDSSAQEFQWNSYNVFNSKTEADITRRIITLRNI
jgi:DNA-directed RNA polymerase subunit RPC12/RpoP